MNSLLKAQLKQLVEHLHLNVDSGVTKAELRKVLIEYFVEEDLISEKEASGGTHDEELKLKQLEIEHKARGIGNAN